ncbi:UNKNOWN [Stylonychia lemnae]|uniref:HMG box domain-containing protein n=1 Tax=Stylonychia lemnae TaxID=5949 RepID=A0A078A4N0_STYLE|nr:UNKNOWN [Stylonychia lemnae]|eukprot:CDW77225.1 UNKNOWN [Stylonychia lemnae]
MISSNIYNKKDSLLSEGNNPLKENAIEDFLDQQQNSNYLYSKKSDEELKEDDDFECLTNKEFQRAMQKLKNRGNNAVPPKKSASAYILFGKDKRGEILKRNPKTKVTEVVKEIAQSWSVLPKQEKQKYKEASKRDRERYEKELRTLESFSTNLKKPKKFENNPEMGALQVMQEIGKQWQAMTDDQKKYFSIKADKDKVRYLCEQKAFYDEVEKVGQTLGTTINEEGQVTIASTKCQLQRHNKKNILNQDLKQHQGEMSILQKRNSSDVTSQTQKLGNITKRQKTGIICQGSAKKLKDIKGFNSAPQQEDQDVDSCAKYQIGCQKTQIIRTISLVNENKPRRPKTAQIYFQEEFRETIKRRLPFLTEAQITGAINFRWENLSQNEKQPFEEISEQDKIRFEGECAMYKQSKFQGKSVILKLSHKNQPDTLNAIQINDDLLVFLEIKQKSIDNDKSDVTQNSVISGDSLPEKDLQVEIECSQTDLEQIEEKQDYDEQESYGNEIGDENQEQDSENGENLGFPKRSSSILQIKDSSTNGNGNFKIIIGNNIEDVSNSAKLEQSKVEREEVIVQGMPQLIANKPSTTNESSHQQLQLTSPHQQLLQNYQVVSGPFNSGQYIQQLQDGQQIIVSGNDLPQQSQTGIMERQIILDPSQNIYQNQQALIYHQNQSQYSNLMQIGPKIQFQPGNFIEEQLQPQLTYIIQQQGIPQSYSGTIMSTTDGSSVSGQQSQGPNQSQVKNPQIFQRGPQFQGNQHSGYVIQDMGGQFNYLQGKQSQIIMNPNQTGIQMISPFGQMEYQPYQNQHQQFIGLQSNNQIQQYNEQLMAQPGLGLSSQQILPTQFQLQHQLQLQQQLQGLQPPYSLQQYNQGYQLNLAGMPNVQGIYQENLTPSAGMHQDSPVQTDFNLQGQRQMAATQSATFARNSNHTPYR